MESWAMFPVITAAIAAKAAANSGGTSAAPNSWVPRNRTSRNPNSANARPTIGVTVHPSATLADGNGGS